MHYAKIDWACLLKLEPYVPEIYIIFSYTTSLKGWRKGELMTFQGAVNNLHDRFGRNIGDTKSHSP